MSYATTCLTDFIGLEGCGTATPDSGLFVNILPGISLKSVDKTADSEQVNYAGVWADVQLRAGKRFFTDLRSELSKRYQIKSATDIVDIGDRVDTTITTGAAAKYRGIFVDLDGFQDNNYIRSNLQQINVQRIRIYLSVASNPTIKIFNAITGAVLFTGAVTGGVVGWNEVEVYEKYTARKIFIAYDSTAIAGVNLPIINTGCCDADCDSIIYGGESSITSTVKESGITKANDSFGLSACYDVQCTYEAFVCCHKEIFANALLYLLGSQLLFELQYSPRINFYTTINAQKAKDLRIEFEAIYKDELMQAMNGINLNTSDCCLECNNQVIIKNSMP